MSILDTETNGMSASFPKSLIFDIGITSIDFGQRSKGVHVALEKLASDYCSLDDLAEMVIEIDGEAGAIGFQMLMRRLSSAGFLELSYFYKDTVLFKVTPSAYKEINQLKDISLDEQMSCSKSMTMFFEDFSCKIDSPEALCTINIVDYNLLEFIFRCAESSSSFTLKEVAAHIPYVNLTQDEVLEIAKSLASFRVFVATQIQESQPRVWWTRPDIQFHHQSRMGYHNRGFGGTYRFVGELDPLPATRGETELTVLFDGIDENSILRNDMSLYEAMETRKSVRRHFDEVPISKDQLGELLYRTMRIRRVFEGDKDTLLDRPEPSGGSINAVDAYCAIRLCSGIDSGLYRYDGLRHGLDFINSSDKDIHRLMTGVPLDLDSTQVPQVMIILAARFGRVMWKYESMAYALLLKDLGVILQSLYLVATSMGLAGCAQGGGDSLLFSNLIGCDDLVESSIGEFALGSRYPKEVSK